MIIDAHVHLPLFKKEGKFQEKKQKLLLDMKKHNIDYSLLIPDSIHESNIGDMDQCLKLTSEEKKLYLLGTINLEEDGQKWIDKLDKLMDKGEIKGIKIFPGHDPIYPTDKRLNPVYDLCLKYGLPVAIHTGENPNNPEFSKYNDPKEITRLSDKYPQLKIVICHFFIPHLKYCFETTKDYKNIYYDISAIGEKSNDILVKKAGGRKKIKQIIEKTISYKGSEKIIFGTDYSEGDMDSHIELVQSLNVSQKDKENIFWKNAINIYNLR